MGGIKVEDKHIKLDIINERTEHNLKIFITNHILQGTHLVHDGWPSYQFLDEEDSVYSHEEHNFEFENFGKV